MTMLLNEPPLHTFPTCAQVKLTTPSHQGIDVIWFEIRMVCVRYGERACCGPAAKLSLIRMCFFEGGGRGGGERGWREGSPHFAATHIPRLFSAFNMSLSALVLPPWPSGPSRSLTLMPPLCPLPLPPPPSRPGPGGGVCPDSLGGRACGGCKPVGYV